MKLYFRLFATLVFISAFFLSANAQLNAQKFDIKGSNGEWFVDQKDRVTHAKIGNFLGRKSLIVKKGSHILRSGVEFAEGIIEFDVAPFDRTQFIGIMFRRDSFQNYENIYLRPIVSETYQALQYAPKINNDATWQIYPEFMRKIDIPRNKWTHVKVEVTGQNLKVYINKSAKPVLEVERLRAIPQKGSVGFWGFINEKADEDTAAFSNVSIRPANPTRLFTNLPVKTKKGVINLWQVAKPLENKEGAVKNLPNLEGWKPIEAEESGLINLNRAFKPLQGRWTGFAKTNIKTDKAKVVQLKFGYSDDVTIFLNGKPIFSGTNGWESRYPAYMGLLKLENDSVYLDLKKGNNELVFAVTNQRFGWGFAAQMKEIN